MLEYFRFNSLLKIWVLQSRQIDLKDPAAINIKLY